jgi:hypothetical protein
LAQFFPYVFFEELEAMETVNYHERADTKRAKTGQRTILIVEDNLDFHMLTKLALNKCGYNVESLFDGKLKEVLTKLLTCDIVLLDPETLRPDTLRQKTLRPETLGSHCARLQSTATHAQWHEIAVAPYEGYEAHGEAHCGLTRGIRVAGVPAAWVMRAALARHDDAGVIADGKNAANRVGKNNRTHGSLLRWRASGREQNNT